MILIGWEYYKSKDYLVPRTRLELVRPVLRPRDFKSLVSTIPPPGHKKSRDDDVMFMRLCQLKTLILVGLLLNSCSLRKKTEVEAGNIPEAKWFSANQEHALEDNSGAKKHLFFDAASTINWSEGTVKFVALTVADSKLSYMLDLASGQPLAKHEYCEQKDIFGDYRGKVNRPSYVQGFIPKVLDQMGEPQKIIYFSQKKKLNAFEQYEAQIDEKPRFYENPGFRLLFTRFTFDESIK